MDEENTETSADAPRAAEVAPGSRSVFADEEPPAPPSGDDPDAPASPARRRRRWVLPALITPVVVLLLAVVAWAVDTSSGGVARNVSVAGVDVGGLSRAELGNEVRDLAARFADTPVEIAVADDTYETTAEAIGLQLDEDGTVDSALAVESDGFVLLRPFIWMRSFVVEREAPLKVLVSADKVTSTVVELEGGSRVPATEPRVELVEGAFHVVPGEDGEGIDAAAVARDLATAAASVDFGEPIRVTASRGPISPIGSDADARDAAQRAEQLVSEPVEVATEAGNRTITPEELRSWVTLATGPEGEVEVALDPARVNPALQAHFADIEGHPVDASFTLEGGVPKVVPDKPGRICCGGDPSAQILAAMGSDQRTVQLALTEGPALFSTATAQSWGITQAVGGNHAWRDGAPTTAAAGFTTYHAPSGARITNIHRIADLVRGAVIPPGGSFSINDHVGRRTAAKGFVPAGAISNGQHVDEIGGGISQFATTMFNAAYFAGLDIPVYQAHSEYFDRYPRGREATMGFPNPDLRIQNNTPYGVLIWTSYTQSSLTVTLYSTPYATAEQTGINESASGNCKVVVTTRTRTFPDGHTENDTFRARYRPGEGQGC